MSTSAASDAGVGQAIFSTRLKLTIQASMFCLRAGALPGFFIPLLLWLIMVSPQGFDLVKLDLMTRFSDSAVHKTWRLRDKDGVRKVVTAVTSDGQESQMLTAPEVRQALKPIYQPVMTFRLITLLAFLGAAIGYFLTWYALGRFGRRNQENQRVRGSESLVTSKELDKLVRNDNGGSYKLVGVSLPAAAPMTGILAQGAQGSGKSLAIHDLMQQVFKRKKKCIIYDQSGEFYRAYFRPGKDFFFNPACEGSVPWSIFSELKNNYDSDTLAQAFLPPKAGVNSGPNAFFEDAARALFSVILLRLTQRGAVNTSDIAKAFFEMPDDEMDLLIEKSVASSAVGGDSKAQRQGVISSIAIYLNGIAAVADGAWSIRDFLDRKDDARLFILGTDDTKAMFSPLYRLLLSVSFAVIAAKQEIVHGDRYWFFLDEVHTLGDIKLDEQLATIRKYGGCIVSGIQSESQFMTSMGKERAETVMNCFNSVLMLRMNEPNMRERAAKRLGKLDMQMVSSNQTLAVTEWRDGAGMNKGEQEKWLVMDSEIGALGDCTGFLQLVGGYPAARVDYHDWLPKRPGAACYVDKFRAVQESPPRDPKFLIKRAGDGQALDAFAGLREELSSKGGGGDKRIEIPRWHVSVDDTKVADKSEVVNVTEMVEVHEVQFNALDEGF